MANIADTAGIFTSRELELFNEMERLVLRDGDVAYAKQVMADAMKRVASTTQIAHAASTGSAASRRAQ